MSKTYQVHVTRDGRWWMVNIPELDELTQARRLSDVARMAQEVIALHTGTPVDDVAVDIAVSLNGLAVSERARMARAHRAEAEALERRWLEESAELAAALAQAAVPVRDIGEILGVSHQRADQLVKSAR